MLKGPPCLNKDDFDFDFESVECTMANFKRSQVCMICCLLSACRFVEFDTSIFCHVLVLCFGSFLLQDTFLNLQVHAFAGQNITFTEDVVLTCILYCDAGPGCD